MRRTMSVVKDVEVEWPLAPQLVHVFDNKMILRNAFMAIFGVCKATVRKVCDNYTVLMRPKHKRWDKYERAFVTKDGVEAFMRTYMHWKSENIAKAMRMMFDDDDEEVHSQSHDSGVVPRKRARDKLDVFMDEMRQIVAGQARLEYMQSDAFKQDCERVVNERVDELVPELRAQLMQQLESTVRKELESKLEVEVRAQVRQRVEGPPSFEHLQAYPSLLPEATMYPTLTPDALAVSPEPVDWSRFAVCQPKVYK